MDADKAREMADKAHFKDMREIDRYLDNVCEKAERLIKNAAETGNYQITLYLDSLCENVKLEDTKNEIWWDLFNYLRGKKYSIQRKSKETPEGNLYRSMLIKWN